MKNSLRVLSIEDSKEDFEIIGQLLKKDGLNCEMVRVETRAKLFQALETETFDVILSDYQLPGFGGLQALEIAHALKPEVPFIFVSGVMGEETAIESFNLGATDYVLKDRMNRLPSAIRRAIADAEEHRLRRQLRVRLLEEARLEAISTLSSGIAHDFNNILAIILGQASLITLEHPGSNSTLEMTKVISQTVQRGAKIIQDLMAFARTSDGHMAMTDINERIREIVAARKENFAQNVTVILALAKDLPGIFADTAQLEGILHKLTANAVESMPDGGTITLSTEFVPAAKMIGSPIVIHGTDYICVKVIDNGRGMGEIVRQHVFEPFYTTKGRGQGTGLGLPVVYGLMRGHHGLVNIESEPGKGTTVYLFFPATQPPSPIKTPTDRLQNSTLRGSATILVTEDEPHVCSFLEIVLQSYGYHVLTAHDYEQAMNLFQAHRDEIQLVLADIGLPKEDGIRLCSELKKLKPDLKIIISSGYSYEAFKSRLDELHIEAFLSKPCNAHDILSSVSLATKAVS